MGAVFPQWFMQFVYLFCLGPPVVPFSPLFWERLQTY